MLARAIFGLLLIAVSCSAGAASLLPLGLERLNADAKYVFLGRCISTETRFDATTQMSATYTSFEVVQQIKGSTAPVHTIKQIGGTLPGSGDLVVPGVPHFEPDQRYVVFLPPASSLGFSSPVGLGQGRFIVRPDRDTATASNGRDFDELLADVPAHAIPATVRARLSAAPPGGAASAQARQRNELPLDEFLSIVRGLQ